MRAGLSLLGWITLCGTALAQSSPAYDRWLKEDVACIISAEERDAFLRLTTAEEQEMFIEQFWLRRDPTPGTPRNEAKEEHYRRIAYANERFASGIPGWKLDRGRVYISFGPPAEIESHPAGDQASAPYEIWRYGGNVTLEFTDPAGTGEYRLTNAWVGNRVRQRGK